MPAPNDDPKRGVTGAHVTLTRLGPGKTAAATSAKAAKLTSRPSAERRPCVFRHTHEIIACAETTWAMIDPTGKPRRIPREILARYGFSD
ncbi:MAG TPA: hypothetical protein VF395_20830 [Polyangiaceae bacterium]